MIDLTKLKAKLVSTTHATVARRLNQVGRVSEFINYNDAHVTTEKSAGGLMIIITDKQGDLYEFKTISQS